MRSQVEARSAAPTRPPGEGDNGHLEASDLSDAPMNAGIISLDSPENAARLRARRYTYDHSTDSEDRGDQDSNTLTASNKQLIRPLMHKVKSSRNPQSLSSFLVKVPLLIVVFTSILVDLIFYTLIRLYVNLHELIFSFKSPRLYRLRHILRTARTYDEWTTAAATLDEYLGNEQWKSEDVTKLYDWELIKNNTRRLCKYRRQGDFEEVKRVLLHGAIKSNCGGVENVLVYSQCYLGTKHLISQHISEVRSSLRDIATTKSMTWKQKNEFFKHADKMYGKTALCLSGGASFGYYHLGVVKCLLEEGLLPKVITGTSAGSLMASMICCRTDEELKRDILIPEVFKELRACEENLQTRFHRLLRTRAMFDPQDWRQKMAYFTFDQTDMPSKLLNYITAPDVVIWSAVLASSAVPYILNPVELMMKKDGKLIPFHGSGSKWRDGSLKNDLPSSTLHTLFNVHYTIVSQVNPHIVLFFYDSRGSSGRPVAHRKGRGWRGGFLMSTLEHLFKLDLQKQLRILRDLQLLPPVVSYLFLQRFNGSVTILPRVKISDYLRILSDPGTYERMYNYFHVGESQTWSHLSMIRNRVLIEKELEEAMVYVRKMKKMEKNLTSKVHVGVGTNEDFDYDGRTNDEMNLMTTEIAEISPQSTPTRKTPTRRTSSFATHPQLSGTQSTDGGLKCIFEPISSSSSVTDFGVFASPDQISLDDYESAIEAQETSEEEEFELP